MMRQAGRYLPEYLELKAKYDFFTRVETPELACAITLQPIDIIQPDAAIIFSDILVVPKAMGMEVEMAEGKGPRLPNTIVTQSDIDELFVSDAHEKLAHVYEAIALTKKELNNRVPLIGFAGAPFTLLCYMIEGGGSKTFDKAKQFCLVKPTLAHQLLQKLTDVIITYLQRQVASGADIIQVFDSWSGLLSPVDFNIFAKPYLFQICDAIASIAPVILYPKGSWYALRDIANSSASAVGIDWCISAEQARASTQSKITLQGNLDPSHLLQPIPQIVADTKAMLAAFGTQHYIANLGHGILPNVPVSHAKAFVDTVKNYKVDERV
jgi:uroporphyrinogen decarboxylase